LHIAIGDLVKKKTDSKLMLVDYIRYNVKASCIFFCSDVEYFQNNFRWPREVVDLDELALVMPYEIFWKIPNRGELLLHNPQKIMEMASETAL
jgi:hypothetical protein